MVTSHVQQFEKAFARYVKADFAIAMCNGTATLHAALVALGVKGDRWEDAGDGIDAEYHLSPDTVAVPPLSMASTTIAVLHAGAVPVFVDVHPDMWTMPGYYGDMNGYREQRKSARTFVPVSLYGLQEPGWGFVVDDAAQTLRKHDNEGFTSYSFQSSKILALGEGGVLVTDDEELADRARTFSSLGYPMNGSPDISKRTLKYPGALRHIDLGWNYRMSPLVAKEGLLLLEVADVMLAERAKAAGFYRDAVDGCSWITPQHKPEGWAHDWWCYAVALESAELWHPFVDAIERHGGERPYACWRITYQEPAFRHLAEDGTCPVAEDLQPRLVQFQTRSTEDARMNAQAVSKAIKELDG